MSRRGMRDRVTIVIAVCMAWEKVDDVIGEGEKETFVTPSFINAGKYAENVLLTGKGQYTGFAYKTFTINKAANKLKVKGRTVKVKHSSLGKKKQTLGVTRVIKFTNKGQGAKSYAKVSGNKKITISKKTGKVTVKKGLKKGSYKVKIKIKAKGSANYKASSWKPVTFRIKVQ